MAGGKKDAEALQKDLEGLDKKIEALEKQLRSYKDRRKKLKAKISGVQASELMYILEEREISFEAAKDILASAKFSSEQEVTNHEHP